MQVEEKHAKLAHKEREVFAHFHGYALALGSAALGVVLSLFSAFVGRSPKSVTDLSSTGQRVLLFSVGLLTLGILIVQVATVLRHRNRDVIRLKKRLAEIYSAALRKSALNPEFESLTPHGRS